MNTIQTTLLTLLTISSLFSSSGCAGSGPDDSIPTPDMAVAMAMGDDPVQWKMQFVNGNSTGMITEFTPPDQSIEAWKEMVAQQITITNEPLIRHVASWKDMITGADPRVQLEEEAGDASVTITYYQSASFNEYSIRRFMQGSDGIYVLAYHSRLDNLDEDRVTLWRQIIANANLVPNPRKK